MVWKESTIKIDVQVYGPDGTTPSNRNGRALVVLAKDSPIGMIVFEFGVAHAMLPVSHRIVQQAILADAGSFDLSDPTFPTVILQQLYAAIAPYIGWKPVSR